MADFTSPKHDEADSSGSEDGLQNGQTAVLLGVPDGSLDVPSDLNDVAVSRVGGIPALLLSPELPISAAHCKSCAKLMELLVQLWCPFENSPMDRALYVWGCARKGCQGTKGSVRAWRGLQFNEKYAARLKRKQAEKRAAEKAKANLAMETAKKARQTSNPFSMAGLSSGPNIFGPDTTSVGPGAQIFSSSSPPRALPPLHDQRTGTNYSDAESDQESTTSDDELLTVLATTTLSESSWKSAPAYPAIYLSTVSEYIPPPKHRQPKWPSRVELLDPRDDDHGPHGNKDGGWHSEAYDNSLDVDAVFSRFTKRIEYEREQCVRYELGGVPLPFASDNVFEQLFPFPPSDPLPTIKPTFTHVPALKRTYSTATVPPCPSCKGSRVFECQLMPNLINVLRPDDAEAVRSKMPTLTKEERRAAIQKELSGGSKDEKQGMEWGTCMIFSCEVDCCLADDGTDAKQCWREETVYVQWERG